MKNNTEDKAERILTIYTKLKQGKVIYKDELSEKYGVTSRTIQRDITDIQTFLQNQFMETGNIQEIVYDKKVGGYRLQISMPEDRWNLYWTGCGAVVKQKDKEGVVVEVETFGAGLEEWLKRQDGKVKNIRVHEK